MKIIKLENNEETQEFEQLEISLLLEECKLSEGEIYRSIYSKLSEGKSKLSEFTDNEITWIKILLTMSIEYVVELLKKLDSIKL